MEAQAATFLIDFLERRGLQECVERLPRCLSMRALSDRLKVDTTGQKKYCTGIVVKRNGVERTPDREVEGK